jgi:pimeloyl-ACP methyl ester carboxylesterase
MPLLETPSLTVDYATAGTGRSVAVLLHGNFASWRWWKPVLDRAPKGFTVYAPMLRGFGATRGEGRARSVAELARDIREFARGLGLKRFHLVGHSLGGAVALEYALTWPETLRGLGLVAPAPGDGLEAMRSRHDLIGHVMRWTDPLLLPSRITLLGVMQWGRVLGTYRPSLARALARMMPSADRGAVDFERLLGDAVAVDDRVLLDVYEALRRWDVRTRLSKLPMDVRILAGRRDALVSVKSLEALARALPRARLDVWDEVGHSPQLEQPAAFSTWLARIRMSPLARVRRAWSRLVARARRLFARSAPTDPTSDP